MEINDTTPYKSCTKCQTSKPETAEFFYKDAKYKGGFQTWCKECSLARRKERYLSNPQHHLKKTKEWARANPERVKQKSKERYERSKDRLLARQKARKQADPERYKAKSRASTRRYRDKNPGLSALQTKAWRKKNPEKRRAQAKANRHKRRAAEGKFSPRDVLTKMDQQKGRCFYCEADIKTRYIIEHFIPISKGGTNWPSNIVLACEPCNSDKRAKLPWEWKPERFTPPHGKE